MADLGRPSIQKYVATVLGGAEFDGLSVEDLLPTYRMMVGILGLQQVPM